MQLPKMIHFFDFATIRKVEWAFAIAIPIQDLFEFLGGAMAVWSDLRLVKSRKLLAGMLLC